MKDIILDLHNNATGKRVQLNIMNYGAGQINHRISWTDKETKRLMDWAYVSRTPLPISELHTILEAAFDDVDSMDLDDFSSKYLREFDLLQWKHRITKDQQPKKPSSWEEFVDLAVAVHTVKNTDYESRFMKAMLNGKYSAATLWGWEVEKKLDRLRTWIKRGELLVKGEGVLDSVIDLSNYTLQYHLSAHKDPYKALVPKEFKGHYLYLTHTTIIRFLVDNTWTSIPQLDLKDETDAAVLHLIKQYMGVEA